MCLPLVVLIPAERGRVILHPSSAIRASRGVRVVPRILMFASALILSYA